MAAFKKSGLFILLILSIVILALRLTNQLGTSIFKADEKAGIRVLSTPLGASLYLDDKLMGKTPYEDQSLVARGYKLKITTEASGAAEIAWLGKVKLSGGTLAVVNRDLAKDAPSSAGEILTLDKGKGVIILSSPSVASVEIDSKDYGTTPALVDVKAGEHTFVIKHSSYLNRSIRAQVPDNFSLTMSVDLALSEADLTNIATPPITQTPKVVVKTTPTGFLRVREKASISSKEVGRVSPGDELILLEESDGWDKVRLPNGTEGFVSTAYIEKQLTS